MGLTPLVGSSYVNNRVGPVLELLNKDLEGLLEQCFNNRLQILSKQTENLRKPIEVINKNQV